ncbi:interleukin-5 receptor subunit alpha-like [Ambystoma mexicanum]|uniref:interleukin-5 receptor subunit alpha-like n=1 Tax=Ambystoma mexicanum TaxID=8296 RepID=UPI0037E94413
MANVDLIIGATSLICFIMLGFPTYIQTQERKCNKKLPKPTNLKLSTSKQGHINLTWDFNVTEKLQNPVKYYVEYRNTTASGWSRIGTFSNIFNRNIALHKGLSFRVQAVSKTCAGDISEEKHYVPEGMNGTAAENVTCVACNTSSMNCTWTVGINAPDDTQYRLSLMQAEKVEECHHYQKDSLGREIACRFHDLKIHLLNEIYILMEGRSNKSKIQFFDEWFTASEVLNPPSNITVHLDARKLTVEWKQPRTSYAIRSHCFKYEISIKDKVYSPMSHLESFTLPIETFKAGEKYILKMRAKGDSCGNSENWGEWSVSKEFGIPGEGSFDRLLTIGGTLVALSVAVLLLICVCKRYNVKQKMWPPIPQPKNNLKDFQQQFITDTEMQYQDGCAHHRAEENETVAMMDFENEPLQKGDENGLAAISGKAPSMA